MKITLKHPITLPKTGDGVPVLVTQLDLRETVCAGDFRGIKIASISNASVDDLLKISSRLSGQPEAVLDRLSVEDFDEMATAVLGFLNAGRGTPISASR